MKASEAEKWAALVFMIILGMILTGFAVGVWAFVEIIDKVTQL